MTSIARRSAAGNGHLDMLVNDRFTPSACDSRVPTASRSLIADENSPFEKLVSELSATLGPDSGLTTYGTDIELLTDLMTSYSSREGDWQRYAFSDPTRGYTRNLVDRGNGKSNLVSLMSCKDDRFEDGMLIRSASNQLILVWTPGKGSPIHDHASSHCVMKVCGEGSQSGLSVA